MVVGGGGGGGVEAVTDFSLCTCLPNIMETQ